MDHVRLAQLIPIIQVAVGPVILISGVGLLLLTMTNRFGRIIDRSRILAAVLRDGREAEREHAQAQVAILWRRARLVRSAIALASVSVLLAAVLVITLFIGAFSQYEIGWLIILLFIASLVSLVGSLVTFLQEINVSLLALRLDLFGK